MMPREYRAIGVLVVGAVAIMLVADALLGLSEDTTGYALAVWLGAVLYFGVFRPDMKEHPRPDSKEHA